MALLRQVGVPVLSLLPRPWRVLPSESILYSQRAQPWTSSKQQAPLLRRTVACGNTLDRRNGQSVHLSGIFLISITEKRQCS